MNKENTELWRLYRETGEREYRDKLIVEYLHLVKFVVGRLGAALPNHVKYEDLYSSGITGLIRSIERFDLSRNRKFEGFACLLIKGAIIDEMRELDWIPRSIHQKAHQLERAQLELQQQLGREPSEGELAHHVGITEEELGELLVCIRPAILVPLNGEVSYSDEEPASLSERIADVRAETSGAIAERKEKVTLLTHAIESLSEQERRVLTLYYYEELMLREIGEIMQLSESRISQIHTKAILKLRTQLRQYV